ncbi:MAG: Flp pilus assembly protein CpaB [Firmicutes bacterium HGW-Firmicutes-7]|nr:MAG: Flp pilus assembly protein CpaB [Firmicutes bacterium HGW-Firmicutes-7]
MRKIFKNRTVLGVTCIFLAILLSFGAAPIVNRAIKSQVTIVRATVEIKEGDEITSDKVKQVKVGEYNLPSGVIKSTDNVIGKYATTTIYKDDFFLEDKITDLESKHNSYLYNLSETTDSLSISITVKSLAAGLSGKLKEGDIVTIISTSDNEKQPKIVPELQYVRVLATSSKEGMDVDEKSEDLMSTITLAVGDLQAEKLVEHEQNGSIHIALAYRGTNEVAKVFLEQQVEFNLSSKESNKEVVEVYEEVTQDN